MCAIGSDGSLSAQVQILSTVRVATGNGQRFPSGSKYATDLLGVESEARLWETELFCLTDDQHPWGLSHPSRPKVSSVVTMTGADAWLEISKEPQSKK
ncbi:hypothetical protein E2C01_042236 [Portunus trituberculatus]|uniref:Uncharacterized protein n=1 Tax=Portunus trituberculatus TaxID=210409 RepID=A0A5B7FU24_PORTR|nr:hypothetical protein [Portunus trituberculatus]